MLEIAPTGNYIEAFLAFVHEERDARTQAFPSNSHQFEPSFPHSAPYGLAIKQRMNCTISHDEEFLSSQAARNSVLSNVFHRNTIERINLERASRFFPSTLFLDKQTDICRQKGDQRKPAFLCLAEIHRSSKQFNEKYFCYPIDANV